MLTCQADVFCSCYMYANCGAIAVIASTTYMTIMELFDEYPAPISPEMMMIVIDHDTNVYVHYGHIINFFESMIGHP